MSNNFHSFALGSFLDLSAEGSFSVFLSCSEIVNFAFFCHGTLPPISFFARFLQLLSNCQQRGAACLNLVSPSILGVAPVVDTCHRGVHLSARSAH